MTMYTPYADYPIPEMTQELAMKYNCTERATEEVLQFARVLCARGYAPEHVLMAVGRYAKVRGEWY
jgi:hypothetical protein